MYTISPKDVDHVRVIYIEVYKNGNTYVSIDSNDRQPISYNGYLMKMKFLRNNLNFLFNKLSTKILAFRTWIRFQFLKHFFMTFELIFKFMGRLVALKIY